ncbi:MULTISPECIES: hypothetical protein [Rufibacter]|uniref:DNA polymerase/3'-5' exonuclease PolX n=1 Tax=Rufibacter quisquiliarum TaxID=1549639 RepID=A0A839GUP8_9BACT|nr:MULTISPECIES: hypothetical protein [Rufibacter]MBA9078607.1 DNA polymerase/3'-5' exonuclease PolX [Rufibacter quisquiliarum]
MKNFTLTLYFLFALVVSAVAQNTPSNPALEKASSDITRLMVESMSLNENEYIKLKNLNSERLVKAAEAEKMYSDDAEMREVRLREIEDDFEEKLFKMLNSRQVTAYAEFKTKPEANFLSLVQSASAAPKK